MLRAIFTLATLLLPAAAFVPSIRQILPRAVAPATAAQRVSRSAAPRLDLPNIDGTGAFRNVQEYPCDLEIKIIGNNEGAFVSDMRTLCAEITKQAEEDVPVRWRDKGKYRSITVKLHFEDADTVRAVACRFSLSLSRLHARILCILETHSISCLLSLSQVYAVYAAISKDPRVKFKI